jgi:hypothetical protein
MATGNHFWLDIVAGIIVATVAGVVINRKSLRFPRVVRRPAPA